MVPGTTFYYSGRKPNFPQCIKMCSKAYNFRVQFPSKYQYFLEWASKIPDFISTMIANPMTAFTTNLSVLFFFYSVIFQLVCKLHQEGQVGSQPYDG